MQWLDYRLHDIHEAGPRRALFDEMGAEWPELRAFLNAVHDALQEGAEDLRQELEDLRSELEGVKEDYYAADAANDDLRADVAYWKEQAQG